QPLLHRLPWQDPRTGLLGVPLLVVVVAVAITVVALGPAGRTGAVPPVVVVGLTVSTGLGLLLALRYGNGTAVAALGSGYGLGLLLCAVAVLPAGRRVTPAGEPRYGIALATVPAGVAIAAIVVRVVRYGGMDNVSVLTLAGIGGVLTARHLVAGS